MDEFTLCKQQKETIEYIDRSMNYKLDDSNGQSEIQYWVWSDRMVNETWNKPEESVGKGISIERGATAIESEAMNHTHRNTRIQLAETSHSVSVIIRLNN